MADRCCWLLFRLCSPGTGKTSSILAMARKINGPRYKSMVLELNASDDRGIDVVRHQIRDFASSRKLFSDGLKLVILDEADAMTRTAQFALRRVIEKYTKSTRFCLLCNYVSREGRGLLLLLLLLLRLVASVAFQPLTCLSLLLLPLSR